MSEANHTALAWRVAEWKRNLNESGTHHEITIGIWDTNNRPIMWGLKREFAHEIVDQHNALLTVKDAAEALREHEWAFANSDTKRSDELKVALDAALKQAGVG